MISIESLRELSGIAGSFAEFHTKMIIYSVLFFATAETLVFLLRNRTSRVKHLIWASAIVIFPLVPLFSSVVGSFDLPKINIAIVPSVIELGFSEPQPSFDSAVKNAGETGIVLQPGNSKGLKPAQASPLTVKEKSLPMAFMMKSTSPDAVPNNPLTPPLSSGEIIVLGILAVYSATVVWMLLFYVLAYIRIGRMIRDGTQLYVADSKRDVWKIPGNVDVMFSANTDIPFVYGFFRPVIVIPEEARSDTGKTLTAVLAHELDHIRRFDPAILLYAFLVRTFFFYNPLIWLAVFRFRLFSEQSSDEAAFAAVGKTADYARFLSGMAEKIYRNPGYGVAANLLFSKSSFLCRINALSVLAKRGITPLGFRGLTMTLAAGAALILFIVFCPFTTHGFGGKDNVTVSGIAFFNGETVEKAEIYLSDPKSNFFKRMAVTGKDGRYSFDIPKEKTIAADVFDPGLFALKDRKYVGFSKLRNALDLKRTLVLMDTVKTVTAYVTDKNGKPVGDANVRILLCWSQKYGINPSLSFPSEDNPIFNVKTGSDGRFSFEYFPEYMSFQILLYKEGYGEKFDSFLPRREKQIRIGRGVYDLRKGSMRKGY